jgi:hypothetical protein
MSRRCAPRLRQCITSLREYHGDAHTTEGSTLIIDCDRLQTLLAASILVPMIGAAQSNVPDKDWRAEISLYGLASAMTGTTTVRGVTTDIDMSFGDIWRNLQFGAMGRGGVHYKRWGVSTDLIYMGLGAVKNNIDVGYDQWMVQPVVEYQADTWISFYAGGRYMNAGGDIRGPQGRTGTGTQAWWDPVVGTEWRFPPMSKFRFRLRGDIGGFGAGSEISGQIEPTIDWRLSKRMSLQLGYRWMYADYQSGEGRDLYRYDLKTTGPQFGATFHLF